MHHLRYCDIVRSNFSTTPGQQGEAVTMIIGVIGGEASTQEVLRQAETVGRLVAERGAFLICGGLGGVMEAACKGAKSAGGTTIGVLPTARKEDANPYVDIPIVTGMGTARNVIIVRTADAIIAIDGRFGTLSEIAHSLDQGKKVVSLGGWPELEKAIDRTLFRLVNSPEEAVETAFENAEEGG